MDRYCVWCDEAITETRKQNKLYCSDKCVGDRHTANNKNEGLGPADYKDHPNGAREQGLPEGGLPWEIQHTLDLEEDSPQITEDARYILSCMSSLPQPKYSDGTSYQYKNTKWDWEINGSRVKKNK
tara:strand:+ start:630 stop:1007 length:378 start_codon:yes stop_codon:yes gene_type:complete